MSHFICQVGHGYAPAALLEGQWEAVERALWAGIRSLEEHADFSERLGDRLKRPGLAQRFQDRARLARENARVLHELLERQTEEAGNLADERTGT